MKSDWRLSSCNAAIVGFLRCRFPCSAEKAIAKQPPVIMVGGILTGNIFDRQIGGAML